MNVATVATKTVPVSVAASSSPPSAGPANAPTLSMPDEATFAAVSSSGVRARVGRSAAAPGGTPSRRDRDERRARIDDRRRPAREGGDRHDRHHEARVRSAASITRSRRIAVGEHREPRRRQRRGAPSAARARATTAFGAAVRLRVHQQRDDVAPLAGDRADVRELEPCAARGCGRPRGTPSATRRDGPEALSRSGESHDPLVLLKQGREDFRVAHPSRVRRRRRQSERAKGERLVGREDTNEDDRGRERRGRQRRRRGSHGRREHSQTSRRRPASSAATPDVERTPTRTRRRARRRGSPVSTTAATSLSTRSRQFLRRAPQGALSHCRRTSSSASSRRSAFARSSSTSASSAAASRATTATSPLAVLERRLRAARALQQVERDRRLVREQPEQLHLLEREARPLRPVEHLEHAERALLDEQRHRHDPLRHVAGLLGDLARVPRVLRQVLDHERLPRDERPAGDARARRDARADRAPAPPRRRSPRTRARRPPRRAGRSTSAARAKIARATSTIERSSERYALVRADARPPRRPP